MGEPLFYVADDGRSVYQRPHETDAGGTAMGFRVCVCDPDVEGAAAEIVRALNRLPQAEGVLIEVAQAIRAGGDAQEQADKIEAWVLEGAV